MTRRRVVLTGVVLAMVAVLVTMGGPRGTDPTYAFVRFLQASNIPVRSSAGLPPETGTYVLLADARSTAEDRPILDWVSRGGRLVVVASPTSALSNGLGAPGRRAGFLGPTALEPGCADAIAAGVQGLVVDASDMTLRPTRPDEVACFVRPGGSYALVSRRGSGSIVLLGGWSFLTNDLLDRGDNALFVRRLIGAGPVVLGPALAPGSVGPGVWDLLPVAARVVVVGSVLSALAFAIAHARRTGAPVEEQIPAPIPAKALVEATGGLYRRARATAFCGQLLRASARSRLARAVGAPDDEAADGLAAEVARVSGVPVARVASALSGPDPTSDADLLRLAGELSAIGARTMRTDEPEGATR